MFAAYPWQDAAQICCHITLKGKIMTNELISLTSAAAELVMAHFSSGDMRTGLLTAVTNSAAPASTYTVHATPRAMLLRPVFTERTDS